LEDGLTLLREAFRAIEPDIAKPMALLLGKAAHLEYRLHHYADALATATRGLQIAVAQRDVDARAQCLKVLGVCQLRLGKALDAKRHFEEALKLAPACSEVRLRKGMLTGLALVQKMLGDYDESQRMSIEALTEDRRLGDSAGEALSLNNLAALHIERQQYASAGEYLKAALLLCERHGYAETSGAVLANLTVISLKLGEHDAARAYGARALEQAQAAGNRFVLSYLRFQRCRLAVAGRDLVAARSELRTGVELALAVGRPALLIDSMACLTEILAAQGEPVCARAVAAFAADHPLTAPVERDEFVRMLALFPAATPSEPSWPGLSLDEVVHRIVVEADIAYGPLIASLRGAH
jgi:tetratricopeptide (TPR) repeat protein